MVYSQDRTDYLKIIFDYSIFFQQPYGGISRYIVQLAKGIISLGIDLKVIAPIHQNKYLKNLDPKYRSGIKLRRFPPKSSKLINIINYQIGSFLAQRYNPDIIHETYYNPNFINGNFKGRILTVYDMIHEKFASDFNPEDPLYNYKKKLFLELITSFVYLIIRKICAKYLLFQKKKYLSCILVLKKFSFGERDEFSKKNDRPFLLYVGNRSATYKNFKSLIHAVASNALLQNTFDIIAFGGGRFTNEEKNLINSLGFKTDSVRQVSGDDMLLGSLYSQARALVYPSLYEGFGLPLLEAMAHDCPIVTSGISSMPEVAGQAGIYFDPYDLDSISETLCSVVFDDDRRKELIYKGRKRLKHFSWAKCAHQTFAVYQKILNK